MYSLQLTCMYYTGIVFGYNTCTLQFATDFVSVLFVVEVKGFVVYIISQFHRLEAKK